MLNTRSIDTCFALKKQSESKYAVVVYYLCQNTTNKKNLPFGPQSEPGPPGQVVQLVEPKTGRKCNLCKSPTLAVKKLFQTPELAAYVQAGQGTQIVAPAPQIPNQIL